MQTFENGDNAFLEARKEKERKYAGLVQDLRGKYSSVLAEAIIVGSLISGDPRNDRILGRLCAISYLQLMTKLMVSETIHSSRNIYVEFVTGLRQDADIPSATLNVSGRRLAGSSSIPDAVLNDKPVISVVVPALPAEVPVAPPLPAAVNASIPAPDDGDEIRPDPDSDDVHASM